MLGKDCLAVLIGEQTASRPWVLYEIEKAWADGLGVFGVHIHGLKDRDGRTSRKGKNPLAQVHVTARSAWWGDSSLADKAPVHDPVGLFSSPYEVIARSLKGWAEDAVRIRRQHR